jgi:hypothetical protein
MYLLASNIEGISLICDRTCWFGRKEQGCHLEGSGLESR